ncbi:2851_t:CDS:1, partial [Funneliformis mosseae]
DTWKNVFIDEDDFEYNYLNKEDNITNLDNDNLSSIISNINSYTTESTSYNKEILPFILNEIVLEKAQEIINANNNNNDNRIN